jgi:hypothetical protein
MRKHVLGLIFPLVCVLAFNCGCGTVAADPSQQNSVTRAAQIFTLTTSDPATFSDPSGAIQPMPSTSLNVQMQAPGSVIVSFSARGTVQPSGSQIIPIVFVECQIDGQRCQPDTNTVEFLYPQFCCDTRSFNWVADNVSTGSHTVAILWGMGNPTSAVVSNRSLIVETTTP